MFIDKYPEIIFLLCGFWYVILLYMEVGNLSKERFVQYLADGFTMKEISKKEGIGIRTLEARLKLLKAKTGAINTNNLIAKYLRNKLIK